MHTETKTVLRHLAALAVLTAATVWVATGMARVLVVDALPALYRAIDAAMGSI